MISKIKFLEICLALAVLGTVVSQSMLDLFSVLLGVGLIVHLKRQGLHSVKGKLRPFGIEWAFLGYFIVVVLGFVLNASADAEIRWQLSKFSWVPTLYVYLYAFSMVRLDWKKVIGFLSIAFLAPNIYALTTYFSKFDYVTKVVIARIIGLLNSSTYHAHANAVILVFFAAVLFFLLSKLKLSTRILVLLAFGIFGLSVFLTFTRGIWVSVFLSSVIMSFLISYRKALAFLALSVVVVTVAYFSWPQFRDRLNPATSSQSSEERKNLFKVNVQMFKENPMLGIGYGENLRRNREYWDKPEWNLPKDYITSHAHNQYLNVLATTGIFGFFFFMSFMLFFLRKNWKMLKAEANKTTLRYALIFGCLWAQIEFFLACLTDVTFEYAKIRALYLMVWALLIAIERHGDKIVVESA